ncbi:MAG TPA: C45 family peptidase [Bryobacteraceae bacterium]|nr:C45 family peptidase [Bryobacteraceae bacterium]
MRILAAFLLSFGLFGAAPSKVGADSARLKKAFRKPQRNGWIFVHLEGSPADIGFQHGYLLAPEIADSERAIRTVLTHDSKDWQFFRSAAETVFWPHIEPEYRAELQGIVSGVQAKGVKLDVWDIVAMNAWLELDPYYLKWADANTSRPTGEHCSAFVATGSYTKDGKPVIAHNNWTDYITGSRWDIIFDVVPEHGNRFLMDGMPGLIHSADDFGINSAGIMITETTISQFHGFNPNGVAEFVRARKAMQYSDSIDDFARIMEDGNNGGYANDWLVADRKTGEIASLELGLKHVNLWRTKDGYFAGSNYPIDPALARDETDFDTHDLSNSANARHVRWDELLRENKGRIDVALGQKFLSDHYDTYDKKIEPDERTLCGHIELSTRGSKPWQPPYGTAGAVENKVADATMADQMSFTAAMGHAGGIDFKAAKHLKQHPEFDWEKGVLRDLDSHVWTTFTAAK